MEAPASSSPNPFLGVLQKQYLILTYVTAYDQYQFPLPIPGCTKPSTDMLLKIIERLQSRLTRALSNGSQKGSAETGNPQRCKQVQQPQQTCATGMKPRSSGSENTHRNANSHHIDPAQRLQRTITKDRKQHPKSATKTQNNHFTEELRNLKKENTELRTELKQLQASFSASKPHSLSTSSRVGSKSKPKRNTRHRFYSPSAPRRRQKQVRLFSTSVLVMSLL